jgi:hypothetical protein
MVKYAAFRSPDKDSFAEKEVSNGKMRSLWQDNHFWS